MLARFLFAFGVPGRKENRSFEGEAAEKLIAPGDFGGDVYVET